MVSIKRPHNIWSRLPDNTQHTTQLVLYRRGCGRKWAVSGCGGGKICTAAYNVGRTLTTVEPSLKRPPLKLKYKGQVPKTTPQPGPATSV